MKAGTPVRVRVLLAKPGLDGHTVGLHHVARALRDAGMEVVYAGMGLLPEQIVEIAVQEDVDVIGLSSLNGAHMTHAGEIVDLVRARALRCAVLLGGIVPDADVEDLRRRGLDAFFGPGSRGEEIVARVRELASASTA